MSEHDSSSERRHGLFTTEPSLDDSWHDAPEPSWLIDEVAEEDLDETGRVPAYDLGPSTESFVVDLTGPLPQVHETAHPEVVDPVEPSRHSAPAEPASEPEYAPEMYAPQEPATPVPTPPVPAVRAIDRTAAEIPPTFDIPPVPLGSAQNQAETLTAATILRSSKPRPQSGWRKRVLGATGGRINFGPSPADRRRADLVERARTPVVGCHRVAVISLKGGVGKTTTTAALGAMFANLRGDRVIAVDANPDRGTLIERVPRQSGATVRHLLEARDRVTRYGDVRAFTSQSPTRLEVLASDADPSASSALSEQDYRDTVDTLERFYNLILDRLRHRPPARRDAGSPGPGDLLGRRQLGQPGRRPQCQRDPRLARSARHGAAGQGRRRGHLFSAPRRRHRRRHAARGPLRRTLPGRRHHPLRRSPRGRRCPGARRARPRDAGRLQGACRCRW
jgi:hypothetical protein